MTNTAIKFAGGISNRDARIIAPEMHTTPDFLTDMTKERHQTNFAAFVRNVTPQAMKLTIPFGTAENLPRMTGSIFANDRNAIQKALSGLRHAAGNFYINDKPTGAVVGQQPFGGSRASGTNDKAGSLLNLSRWISPRSIKECWVPPTSYAYPYMGQD